MKVTCSRTDTKDRGESVSGVNVAACSGSARLSEDIGSPLAHNDDAGEAGSAQTRLDELRRGGGASATEGAHDARRLAYERYISSRAWLASPARLGELAAAGHRCRLCDRGPPEVRLHVHHRTYARFGRELQRDLTTVCEDCHVAVTGELRARSHAAKPLPPPRDVVTYASMRTLVISKRIDDVIA